ncbi:MAG: PAS domain-containing protein [Firmicutes bacterium]|nr:PAS domain-containing protein [Bacillota bacterium]HXL03541.1 PAS domain-containing protein [Bacillota bacterium]
MSSLYLLKPESIDPEADINGIMPIFLEHGVAYVVSPDSTFLGAIYKSSLPFTPDFLAKAADHMKAKDLMTPREDIPCVFPETHLEAAISVFLETEYQELPVLENDRLVGSLPLRSILKGMTEALVSLESQKEQEKRSGIILQSINEGLIMIDKALIIREYNRAAEELLGAKASERIGSKAVAVTKGESPVFEVMQTGKPRFNVMSPLADGRIFSVNYVPMLENGNVVGVIQTFRDITEQETMRAELVASRDELDRAFALTLPNSRVEHKLKNTPEYRDIYNLDNGQITITEVIADGGYKHVVNALKVLADLNNKGIMSLLGINKDVLVQSIIFHDLGKSQPQFEIGQTVNPLDEFEESYAHAQRSADIAAHFYQREADVIWLIKYHHHEESQLPGDFPNHLRPMLRLLKLVDGLSAALTRRDATIRLDVDGTRVYIYERNAHPDFNRSRVVDLFTGETIEIPDYPATTG